MFPDKEAFSAVHALFSFPIKVSPAGLVLHAIPAGRALEEESHFLAFIRKVMLEQGKALRGVPS
ncbi:MAG: hypothetical protein QS99_C0018G0040 [archaeon GW2011_AR4]|nr:MAG: hypothetical protein QS99_C0018G0040 [archaeon GW2011_AR4]